MISAEVAKTVRPANFLEYSYEWQRLRDAKVQQAKILSEAKIQEESRPLSQANERKLPENYKGVISGYYD